MNDFKFAFRQLLKNPGFTAVAVLTLALGIGANLTIFAVVDAILLRPLPLPESERLVTIYHDYPKSDMGRMGTSIPDLYDRRGKVESLTSIGAYKSDSVVVGEAGAGRREEALRVSSDFLETLGVHPWLGQAFTEDQMTFQTHHVAILSNDYWKRQFDADPQVLGRKVRVNGFDKTIVAVLPAGFRFLSNQPQILLPLSSQPNQRGVERLHSNNDWGMIARLRDGATLAQAQAQLNALDAAIQPRFEWAKQVAEIGYRAMVAPLHANHVASIRPTLLLLQAGGFLLLLIAAVNLVNLLLVRASVRVKELGVRQSLGASRGHLLRQTLTETLMLSSAGGLAGLGLGAIGVRLLRVFGVNQVPLGLHVALDGRVILAAAGVSVAFGAVVGLALTAFYLRHRLADVLKAEGRGGTGSRGVQRLRHGFVAAQMARVFALTALLLAAVGTYGVLGVAVAQRRREIGLRMALGALPRQIGRQFLLLGLRLLAVGSAFGLLGAWLAGKAMQSQLFAVPPIHAATFGKTFLILGAVALLACLLPALRASRVAPSEALRSE